MTDYKLVPVEPAAEMVVSAEDAYMPFGDMDLALRMAILAAPAAQGEPVAYLRKDQLRQVQRMGPMFGEIADSPRVDRVPVYAAPQPAEQQPDVAQLVEALEKYESAFEELFAQCCSNPITNAWGKPVSTAALNDAHSFASSRLAAHRKQQEGQP